MPDHIKPALTPTRGHNKKSTIPPLKVNAQLNSFFLLQQSAFGIT